MNNDELIRLGSQTARSGFQNEKDVIKTFNNWTTDELAQQWLVAMEYNLDDIEYVSAQLVKGHFKADIQVQVTIKLTNVIDCQNIQVKLVSNKRGFNQIDKRWIERYQSLWNMPENIANILKHYTGELPPYRTDTRDRRRMFLDEMSPSDTQSLITWLTNNKPMIINDILKGRGHFSAEWILVIRKTNKYDWVLLPINVAINHYSVGDINFTNRGTLHIGRITMQRKGGDNGRDTAKMLQFKLDPTELFNLNVSATS